LISTSKHILNSVVLTMTSLTDAVNDIAKRFALSSRSTLFVHGEVELTNIFSKELLDNNDAINKKLNEEVLGMIKQRLKNRYKYTLSTEWAIAICVSSSTIYLCLIHEDDPYEKEAMRQDLEDQK
jgi:hypothetical protein